MCVDDGGIPPFLKPLKKGKTYTVRAAGEIAGVTWVYLDEVENGMFFAISTRTYVEPRYAAARFQPAVIVSGSADVALFRHHLTGAGALV